MKRLLAFGDSNTYGFDPRSYFGGRYDAEVRWPEQLAHSLGPEWTLLNEGANGRCIPPAGTRLPAAELTLVMLGSNDLLMGADAEDTAERMEAFLAPNLPRRLLLLAPPQMEPGAWVPDPSLIREAERCNAALRTLAAALGVPFFDVSSLAPPLAFDGVHLLPAGHAALAAGLAPVVQALAASA